MEILKYIFIGLINAANYIISEIEILIFVENWNNVVKNNLCFVYSCHELTECYSFETSINNFVM